MLRVFAQYRFRCVLGELGRFWEGTGFQEPVPGDRFCGSGNQFREPATRFDGSDRFCCSKVPGSVFGKPGSGPGALPRFWVQKVACPRFRRFRCWMSSDGLGSVPKVWTEPALGTGFRESEVLRKFRVSEIPLPRFQKLLCTYFESKLLYFESKICTLKVNFCTLKVNFCTLKAYFCTLKVCFCTLKLYFCTLKVHFYTLKVYFCTLPQCLLQVALKINTARAKKRW